MIPLTEVLADAVRFEDSFWQLYFDDFLPFRIFFLLFYISFYVLT